MKKEIVGLLCSVAISAFAQTATVEQKTEEHGPAVQHERVTKHTEMQGSPRQINRMQRDQNRNERFEGKTEEHMGDRARVQGEVKTERVEPRENNTNVEINSTNRVENRGGKFFFRNREIVERRDFDRNDWHFRLGEHPRVWWTTHYSNIVFINGCWYYEDNGLFYPAYGYDPSCSYPDTYIVFTFGD